MKKLAPLVLLLVFASCECEKITDPPMIGERVPNATGGQAVQSSLSFIVPTTGGCGNESATLPLLSHAEIWTGHAIADAHPYLRLWGIVDVMPGDTVTRNVARDGFVRVRLVAQDGTPGCFTTLGEMYFKKPEGEKAKVKQF